MTSNENEEYLPNLHHIAKAIGDANVDETVRVEETNAPKMDAVFTQDKKNAEDSVSWENCDFETAIAAAGYGKYNVFIMSAFVFPMVACMSATSTMSLILPSVDCDLSLSNFQKGILNASTFIGMICSAFFWGFLSDTLGRQKLLVISFTLDAVFHLTAGLAQSFEVLLAAKLMAGLICSGCLAISMTYLAECHSAKHRASIIQWIGVFGAFGTIVLLLLAWAVIPRPWVLNIATLHLPAWRIFLIICTIPAIISAITFSFQQESPKFLMTKGRNNDAMNVFQLIYARNFGNPKATYPVQSLIQEVQHTKGEKVDEEPKSTVRFLKLGWLQTKPLFLRPHLSHALLVFMFQGCSLLGYSTLRLWMPQLFSLILQNEHLSANATSVCELLTAPKIILNETIDCSQHQVDSQVYINSIVIGLATAVSYLISGYLINVFGKKWLIIAGTYCSVVICTGMYWATTSNAMLALASLFISLTSVTTTAIVSVVVDLFPTTLRTVAVSLTLMFGRCGVVTGNLIFPLLLDLNCTVPFFLIAALMLFAGCVVFALPKTKGKALE